MAPTHAILLACLPSLLFSLGGCCNDDPLFDKQEPDEPPEAKPQLRPARCHPIGRDEVVGARSTTDSSLDNLLPFATEVGDGVAFEAGFAVGALCQEGQGTAFAIVTTNRDASVWRTVSIKSSHGDAEAPRVFASGTLLGVALLEPSGASRSLRLGRVDRDSVHWGAEFVQGVDESLAFDVAIGVTKGVVVWDDVPKGRKASSIVLATFDPATLGKPSKPTAVTPKDTDAEMPRVIARPGGFWLFWLARRPDVDKSVDFGDTRYQAEGIDHRWIEAVPLDGVGVALGKPSRLGPSDGHVLGYGVALLGDGSAVVIWRDDDTPSGSAGGQLYRARVSLGGIDGPDLVDVDASSVGAPKVMSGWFAIGDSSGVTRLAPMAGDGTLVDRLMREDALGSGEPIANLGNDILISRPDGASARLFVVRCESGVLDGGLTDAEGSEDVGP